MKTYELARAAKTIAEHCKATETERMMQLIAEVKDASATHLKKSTEVFIVKNERIPAISRQFGPVFSWVKCDAEGRALTPTGRVMTGSHIVIAYR